MGKASVHIVAALAVQSYQRSPLKKSKKKTRVFSLKRKKNKRVKGNRINEQSAAKGRLGKE